MGRWLGFSAHSSIYDSAIVGKSLVSTYAIGEEHSSSGPGLGKDLFLWPSISLSKGWRYAHLLLVDYSNLTFYSLKYTFVSIADWAHLPLGPYTIANHSPREPKSPNAAAETCCSLQRAGGPLRSDSFRIDQVPFQGDSLKTRDIGPAVSSQPVKYSICPQVSGERKTSFGALSYPSNPHLRDLIRPYFNDKSSVTLRVNFFWRLPALFQLSVRTWIAFACRTGTLRSLLR